MIEIREYNSADAFAINELAVSAFNEYREEYQDWPQFSERLRKFSSLSEIAEIIVATNKGYIVGAVGYVPAEVEKPSYFPAKTPVIRMLVASPNHRSQGVGKKLSQECIDRAIRDKCESIALHTSQIMSTALSMYLSMGFKKVSDVPDINGVTYGVYIKNLSCVTTLC